MTDKPNDPNAARARRTELSALLDTAIVSISKRVVALAAALEKLEPAAPAGPLADELERVVKILAALRDQSLAREWSTRLAAAILRNQALLGSTPGSPQLRKVGAWAARVSKESSLDQRTVSARNLKEAARTLAARARLGDQGTGESAEA